MTPGPDADPLHLDLILDRIALIRKTLARTDFDRFSTDRNLIDATAYRLANIGESSRKLSGGIKERNPQVPWERIYRLRNIVVHAYETVDPSIIWEVATTQLDALEAVCRIELERLGG